MRPFKLLNMLITAQRGFSLTEVLVGGGILAGVALAGARMFNDQKTAQKKVQDEQKLNFYHQNLVKLMNLASNCNATLKRAGLYNSSFTANTVLSSGLHGCIGPTCIDNNRNADGTINLTKDANSVDTATTKALLVPVPSGTPANSVYIDDSKIWYAQQAVIMTTRTTTGPVSIRVTYKLNPRIGNKTILKDIVFNARFSGGRFKECLSGQESNINNLQNDFCKTLNFDETTSLGTNHGKLARWDEATQSCVVGTEKRCDTPGMVVDGLDSTGTIRCRAIIKEGEASSLQQPVGTICLGGAIPQLVFDHFTRTLQAKCP